MKKIMVLVLSIAMLMTGCKKKNDTPDTYGIIKYPHEAVIVFDNGAGPMLRYIRSIGQSIAQLYETGRQTFDAGYIAANVSESTWIMDLVGNGNIVTARLKDVGNSYWYVATQTHPITNDTEHILRVGSLSSAPGTENYFRFRLYSFNTSNGATEVAFESVGYPGYYLTEFGHSSAGTGILLKPYDDKDRAPRFKRYITKM